jgi:acyl-CoA synthetase (NDP forming)/GNAT superfamily N-acetyltransferase
MNATQQASRVYALLADGTTVEIRPATPADFDAVLAMYEAMSPDNTYLRFFNLSRRAAEAEAQRTCRDPSPGHVSLLALSGDVVVGCAGYYTFGATAAPADQVTPGAPVAPGAPVTPVAAEIAFAVGEHMHHRGIATLLLEHLVSVAASHQVQAFTAETRAENTAMLKVFADAGLPVHRRYARGVVELTFPIPRTDDGPALDTYLNAVAGRERLADAASLRHLFAPESVVVIGASRRPGTVGRAILDNVRTGGYLGRLYAVNPHAEPIGGIPCWPAVADLPEAPDLAVIAVPAASVLDTVEQCGRRGVQSVVVITSGLDADGCAGLLAACRQHGMRLVGPNCFGVAVPGIGLDATFAASHPRPGSVGLVTQSGGLGFAMVDQLSRLGIGISSFASVGNKLDVSSNDLLLWWEQDGLTKLAVLYIESFGNPRKFARTARRVGATMPVLTVHAGRSAAGQRAAASHTAAVATPLVSREALFAQAGIIATPGLGELTEVTALLATQPVPAGGTVAIVSNVGGAGVLTADACADLGLAVHHPAGQTSRKLRALLPGGTVSGPVDTTAAVSGADFRQCLELLAADEDVDAMIVLVLPTAATGDLIAAIAEADLDVPVAAVVLNQPETVRLITRASGGQLPAYGFPEAAVSALARAVRYGAWRAEPSEPVPDFADIRPADARALVYRFLDDAPAGGWLPPGPAAELLRCYGITLTGLTPVASEDEAVAAAAATGGPVVLKADVPGLVHKTDAGAVQLDLRTQADVRDAYRSLQSRFTGRLRRILVQPMIIGGTEVIIGVVDDHMFGPLVVFGLGGVATEVLADHAARLTPLSGTDADQLIGSIRSARLLLGHRGTPAADLGALRELLLRVSRLADDLPEITDLDLNPVIARPDGAFAVDARVKVAPYQPEDPYLRKLR